jgi:hypothetical protein
MNFRVGVPGGENVVHNGTRGLISFFGAPTGNAGWSTENPPLSGATAADTGPYGQGVDTMPSSSRERVVDRLDQSATSGGGPCPGCGVEGGGVQLSPETSFPPPP